VTSTIATSKTATSKTSSATCAVLAALRVCPVGARWLIAYSGGLDSTVLLHAAHRVALERGVSLHALHVNHQLSLNAEAWQAHCADQCAALGREFAAVCVQVVNQGAGLEAAARAARYRVFAEQLGEEEQLLLAHHRDDQAETLLLRLMRGAGPAGLGAMQEQRPLGLGTLRRPLLGLSRTDLEGYASTHQLSWVEDDSNASLDFDRNFLRHQVMPQLEQRWPGFTQRWQQSASLCQQSAAADEQRGAADLAACQPASAPWGWSISLGGLQALDAYQRGNLLRYWLKTLGLAAPEHKHLQQVESQLLEARIDARSQVSWGTGGERVKLCVYRQRFYVLPDGAVEPLPTEVSWCIDEPLQWGPWLLTAEPVSEGDAGIALPSQVVVRSRAGGERCKPVGRGHSQSLKKLLQEYAVEPWLRDQLPLIFIDGGLAAVADRWVCDGFVEARAPVYRLRWQRGTNS